MLIQVAARDSELSKAQVKEVFHLLKKQHPLIDFDCHFLKTHGDLDRTTSLRTLEKTNFFTKEVDDLLLKGFCRIAIHSAKDLPSPLPKGLTIAAITEGLDSSDVLVLKKGFSLETLPDNALIATSSIQRENRVLELKKNVRFCDLRGTIKERLALLDSSVDGVVVAEAALIRLGLTALNRIKLPGLSTPLQGQLAICCRENDQEMLDLFKALDSRLKKTKILYLGLEIPEAISKRAIYTHFPIIHIKPRNFLENSISEAFKKLPSATHLLFTSKTSVHLFFKALSFFKLSLSDLYDKVIIAVGSKTSDALASYDLKNSLHPKNETAEGICDLLDSLSLDNPYFFWPHSALSRDVLTNYFIKNNFNYCECVLYDTETNKNVPLLELDSFDEIHFTSPSTIDAFKQIFGSIPKDKTIKTIGPITAKHLELSK